MKCSIAVIGGSAMPCLQGFAELEVHQLSTPFGEPSDNIIRGSYQDLEILFLDRHGRARATPPHKINYRANIWALKELGIARILSVSIVGGIRSDMTPGHFVFPDQLIDYTYGRPSSFYEDDFDFSKHIDFTHPYCPQLHRQLVVAAESLNLSFTDDATYGVTQGPRFETVAEINRMERDGCDIVGMTAMPEAVLAREKGMSYASIGIVGTKAAGRSDGLHVDIKQIQGVIGQSMEHMHQLLARVLTNCAENEGREDDPKD